MFDIRAIYHPIRHWVLRPGHRQAEKNEATAPWSASRIMPWDCFSNLVETRRTAETYLRSLNVAPLYNGLCAGVVFNATAEVAAALTFPVLGLPVRVGSTLAITCLSALMTVRPHAVYGALLGATVATALVLAVSAAAPTSIAAAAIAGSVCGFCALWPTDSQKECSPPLPDIASAPPTEQTEVVNNTSNKPNSSYFAPSKIDAWRAGMQQTFTAIQHKYSNAKAAGYAKEYNAHGLLRLKDTLGGLSENTDAACNWINKLAELQPSLTCIPPREIAEKEAFMRVLDGALAPIWGNVECKRRIKQVVIRQLNGTSQGHTLSILGPPGSSKTLIAHAVSHAYGSENCVTINCGEVTENYLLGHQNTYVSAHPSPIGELLMKRPHEYLLVHLDELDKATTEVQKTLLSLLEPTDRFVDKYFGLPLNKSRIFIIVTMNTLVPLIPALRSRLEVDTLEASQLTLEGIQCVILSSIKKHFDEAVFGDTIVIHAQAIANELMRILPGNVDGRNIDRQIRNLVNHAKSLEDGGYGPRQLGASLVRRWYENSWADYVSPSAMEESAVNNGQIQLYAVRKHYDDTPLHWIVAFNEDIALRVSLSDTNELHAHINTNTGSANDIRFRLQSRNSRSVDVQSNEFFNSETANVENKVASAHSTIQGTSGMTSMIDLEAVENNSYRVNDEEYLLTLDVILEDRQAALLAANAKENGYL